MDYPSSQSGEMIAQGAPFFDLLNPEFEYESADVAEARERSWFATTPHGIIVLRHREGLELLRDRRFGLGSERAMAKLGVASGPLYDMWMDGMARASADDHARLRGLVSRWFAPSAAERLRPFVRATAEGLVDQIQLGEECEFVAAFADPLPAFVMCEMLGVPPEDYDKFHRASNDVALAFTRSVAGLLPRIEAAIVELSSYIRSLVADRRAHLGDDLISSLITAEEADDRLTERELHNLVLQLVWAGQDTTARQLGRALVGGAGRGGAGRVIVVFGAAVVLLGATTVRRA